MRAAMIRSRGASRLRVYQDAGWMRLLVSWRIVAGAFRWATISSQPRRLPIYYPDIDYHRSWSSSWPHV